MARSVTLPREKTIYLDHCIYSSNSNANWFVQNHLTCCAFACVSCIFSLFSLSDKSVGAEINSQETAPNR